MANEVEIVVTGTDKSSAAFDSVKRSTDDATDSFEKFGEAGGTGETRAQGFSDTLTGLQDSLLGAGMIAKGPSLEGFVALGGGLADLGGGIEGFLAPAIKMLRLENLKNTASMIASKTASIASAVATRIMTTAQWALNVAMRANPIMLVVTALTLLVAGIILAYKKSETFRNIVNGAWKAVRDAALATINFITDKFIPIFTKKIPDAAKSAVDWIRDHWKAVILGLFTGGLSLVLTWISQKFNLKDKVSNVVGSTVDWIKSHWKEIVLGLLTGPLGLFVAWVATKWNIREKVADVIGRVVEIIKSIPERLANLPERLFNLGERIIGQMLKGILSAMSGIRGWIKDKVVDPIIDAVKDFFGISSPSKVMKGLGGHLLDGLLEGFSPGNWGDIAKKVFGGMPEALSALAMKGLAPLAGLASGLDTALFGNTLSNQQIGRRLLAGMGWSAYWPQFNALVMGESGWNNYAQNPTSSAFGIGQFLDSTWATVGYAKTTDAGLQIAAMLKYILQSYGNPAAAYSAWLSRSPHWYGSGLVGGIFNSPTLIGVGERGPEQVDITPLGAGRGGRRVVLELRSSGAKIDDFLLELLRKSIRVKGGDVQVVLGS